MKYFVLITDNTALPEKTRSDTTPFLSSLAAKGCMGTVSLTPASDPLQDEADLSLMGLFPSKEKTADETEANAIGGEAAPLDKGDLTDHAPQETKEDADEASDSSEDGAASAETAEGAEEATEDIESIKTDGDTDASKNADIEGEKPLFASLWQTSACYFTDQALLAEKLAALGMDAHCLSVMPQTSQSAEDTESTPTEASMLPLSAATRAAYASGYELVYFRLTSPIAASNEDALALLDSALADALTQLTEADDVRVLVIAAAEEGGSSDRPYLIYPAAFTDDTILEETDACFTYEATATGKYVANGAELFASLLEKELPPSLIPAPDTESPAESKPSVPLSHSIFEWVELFVFSLAAVLILMTFFVRHSPVSGSSMTPTLHNSDVLVISRLGYTPKNGDIVIIQTPLDDPRRPLVKRIIATGGQTVRINFETWAVYVDGELIEEDYINHSLSMMESYFTPYFFEKVDEIHEIYEAVVPENHVFVMGDNRNNSKDSRTIGFVDERYIVGDVKFRIFPLSDLGEVD